MGDSYTGQQQQRQGHMPRGVSFAVDNATEDKFEPQFILTLQLDRSIHSASAHGGTFASVVNALTQAGIPFQFDVSMSRRVDMNADNIDHTHESPARTLFVKTGDAGGLRVAMATAEKLSNSLVLRFYTESADLADPQVRDRVTRAVAGGIFHSRSFQAAEGIDEAQVQPRVEAMAAALSAHIENTPRGESMQVA